MRTYVLALLPMMAITCLATVSGRLFAAPQSVVVDVAIGESGDLVGQVVDAQGTGMAGQTVILVRNDREVARTTTDGQGNFSVDGVGGGIYQLVADNSEIVVRAWIAGTQPPIARRGVLLVSGQDVYRGQQAVRSVRNFMANPVTVAGVVAAGIAVPVAVHHSRNRSPASP